VIPLIDPGENLTGSVRAPRSLQRTSRLLAAFLAGSVAVHAAVLVVMPPLVRERELPNAATLEVVLLKAESMTIVPSEIAPQPLPRQPQPERIPAKALPELQPERRAPVLALSESWAAEGASSTVEPAGVPEPAVASPEQRSLIAGVAVTPPGFNAAYLRNPAPRYPLASRRAGEQGTVTLRVRVALDGSASRVAVEKSSGSPHLDAAALEAVKAWRFAPARQGAERIESWMLVPIVFRLEGSG
jgi:protein TonB